MTDLCFEIVLKSGTKFSDVKATKIDYSGELVRLMVLLQKEKIGKWLIFSYIEQPEIWQVILAIPIVNIDYIRLKENK